MSTAVRLNTDIYSSNFTWVRPEWIAIKEAQGRNPEEVMGQRRYNAFGYTGAGVEINRWHNALSYDEETSKCIGISARPKSATNVTMMKPRRSCSAPPIHPHGPFWPPQEPLGSL
ncbi:MAG: hypothetical protein R2932_16805 [Caldilineaceae bacterium]